MTGGPADGPSVAGPAQASAAAPPAATSELAALLDGLLEAVWLVDGRTRQILAANTAAGRLLGVEPASWQGVDIETLLQSPEDALFWIEAATNTKAGLDSDTLLARADGIVLSVRRRIAFVQHGSAAGHWLLTMRDQTRQRALEQARTVLAMELQAARLQRPEDPAPLDTLTQLPGRAVLAGRVEAAVAGALREGRSFALMNVDLDRFKQINDTLGRGCGDRVLRDVAERLQRCLGDSDLLARLGGDEYALLIDAVDARGAEVMAMRVQGELALPFTFEALDFTVTCSIGIALFPRDGGNADELLSAAEQAMHWVKESGRSAWRFHQPRRHVDLMARACGWTTTCARP